jgi:hypothetical protein
MTITGPIRRTAPGTAFPATLLAELADGTSHANRDAWIILWDYTPTGDDTADLVITTGREDRGNPGRIVPGSEPYRVSYRTGHRLRAGSLAWTLAYDREPREYTGLGPENTPEVMAAAMIARAATLGTFAGERLTASQAARVAGVQPTTFRSYVSRGQAPEPDGHIDKRTPYWLRSTIAAWRPESPADAGSTTP